MPGLIDLRGRRFGKLVAELLFSKDDLSRAIWWCRCDCGWLGFKHARNLVSGRTRSCGGCGPMIGSKELARKAGLASGRVATAKRNRVAA